MLAFYASQIPKAAAQGAQVVVLPEKIVGVTADDRAALQSILSSATSSSHVWLIAGVNEIRSTPKNNTVKINAAKINAAWIFSPDGAFVGEYHKHYFVTGFEAGYQSGKRIEVLDAPWGKTAVAICKDLDYPWFIRGYGAKDATLMLVPAWDWEGPNAVMHERMATVRGVENGFGDGALGEDRIRHRARRIRPHPGVELNLRRRPRDGRRRHSARTRNDALLPPRRLVRMALHHRLGGDPRDGADAEVRLATRGMSKT